VQLSRTYNGVDPLGILLVDWARYRCWRAERMCEELRKAQEGRSLKSHDSGATAEDYICTNGATKRRQIESASSHEVLLRTLGRLQEVAPQLKYGTQRDVLAALIRKTGEVLADFLRSADRKTNLRRRSDRATSTTAESAARANTKGPVSMTGSISDALRLFAEQDSENSEKILDRNTLMEPGLTLADIGENLKVRDEDLTVQGFQDVLLVLAGAVHDVLTLEEPTMVYF